MSDVLYLRSIDPAATPDAVLAGGEHAGGCFDLHRVDWVHSFLAADGRRMLCWYRAPDAESARLALRELGSDMGAVWPGRVIGGVEPGDPAVSQVDVLAEVALDPSSPGDDGALMQRLQSVAEGDTADFRFGFMANRRDRLVCLLQARDAGAAASALEKAGLPAAVSWPCTVVTP